MTNKQTAQAHYPSIQAEGCLLMSLLDIACAEAVDDLMPLEVNRIYDYAVPKYMEPTCFVKEHEEIIRLGFYILGHRFTVARYIYRRDENKQIIGKTSDIDKCNYFVTMVDAGTFRHFYRSDEHGYVLYNPGISTGRVLSIRGYAVKILGEG